METSHTLLSSSPHHAFQSSSFTTCCCIPAAALCLEPIQRPHASAPRLPKEQQEEFELLQKMANSQAAIDEYNRQIEESGSASSDVSGSQTDVGVQTQYFKTIPEFEGDRNPETGEVGGPKQDPLRHNDWSFNGRVTDFKLPRRVLWTE